MKVLLINGSPHKEGCTFTALSEVAAALNHSGVDTQILHMGSEAIHGCTACLSCRNATLGKCVFDKDRVNDAIELMKDCDGLVVGSPVYYASANGSIISFLDRMFYASGGAFAHKPAAAIVSARRGGTTASLDQLNKYFSISQMPLVPSTYWCMVHGNTADEVRKDLEGLQTMRNLGNNMAWLLKLIESGRSNGINPPANEKKERTSFIR